MATTKIVDLRPPTFPDARTIILTISDLADSPHFPALYSLENEAFNHAHMYGVSGKQFLNQGRFTQPQDMLDEIGPDGFCMIMFEHGGENAEIIGSISAKPFTIATQKPETNGDQHPRLLFKRAPPEKIDEVVEGETGEKWELLAMAVALRVKGKGVAGLLMEECIEEIRREIALAAEADTDSMEAVIKRGEGGMANGPGEKGEDKKIVLYLSTLQDINEGYYLRRGWRTTSVKRVEKGTAGAIDGFGIVEMIKVV